MQLFWRADYHIYLGRRPWWNRADNGTTHIRQKTFITSTTILTSTQAERLADIEIEQLCLGLMADRTSSIWQGSDERQKLPPITIKKMVKGSSNQERTLNSGNHGLFPPNKIKTLPSFSHQPWSHRSWTPPLLHQWHHWSGCEKWWRQYPAGIVKATVYRVWTST